MRAVVAPPLMPAMGSGLPPAAPVLAPMPVLSLEAVAQALRQGGDRRIAVAGTTRNAGTTYAAIMLARMLAQDSNVVLVDLAFGAPNVSVISTDPNAPGIAELVSGAASFGEIITCDQASPAHLVATGQVGHEAHALAASPMLTTAIEALAQSYDHVVLDIGSVAEIPLERFAALAPRAALVASNPAAPATRAARDRLMQLGLSEVMLVSGAPQQAAA
jgi:Mrp family chromosome partitioning ATPase